MGGVVPGRGLLLRPRPPAPAPSPAPAPAPTPAPAPAPAPCLSPLPRRLLLPAPAADAAAGISARRYKPGDAFRDCPDCGEVVVVAAGSFEMGSTCRFENPVHRVTIAKPFAIGRHEVTFNEWDRCVDAGGCKHRRMIAAGDAAIDRSSMSAGPMPRHTWPGSSKDRTSLSAALRGRVGICRARRHHHASGGGASSAPATPIVGTVEAAADKRPRSDRSRQVRSASTIPRATWPSGSRTAGTTIIAARRRTDRRGPPANAGCGCCAAARSTVRRDTCDRRHASGMISTCATSRMVFESCASCASAADRSLQLLRPTLTRSEGQ